MHRGHRPQANPWPVSLGQEGPATQAWGWRGVSGWHLAVPPEHFQATCGFWMWEVPLMQAGVRGILFNVLGGGREGRGNREGRA